MSYIKADTVLLDGEVHTADQAGTVVQAVAVLGDRVIAAGRDADMDTLTGPATRVYRVAGRAVVPGFNDAHCHMLGYGLGQQQLDCGTDTVPSIKALQAAVRARAATLPPGGWILGRGYDHTRLAERRHPTRDELDQAAPGHPVLIWRVCGHVAVANSRALELAGVSDGAPDPPGGRYGKEGSRLTGLLEEEGQAAVRAVLPVPNVPELVEALAVTSRDYLAAGITSSTDAGVGRYPRELEAWQQALETGALRVRVTMMPVLWHHGRYMVGRELLAAELRTGSGNQRLRMGGMKLFQDGSLGGATAAVREPYPAGPDDRGVLVHSQERLDELVWEAHRAGWQVGVHAIGDRAIDMVLLSYERALRRLPRRGHRHRVEHCGLVPPDLMARLARLGVVAVPQPAFLWYLGDSYLRNLGPGRLEHAYPMASWQRHGVVAAAGSDCRVIPHHPLVGLFAALTRRTRGGQVIAAAEAVDLASALRAYTFGGAFATGEEERKGTLEPTKLADLAVLSRGLRDCPVDELPEVTVQLTMVGGEVVYQSADL